MKKYIYIGLAILVLVTVAGCKTRIQYLPVESIKTEYRDNYLRDSIFIRDSVVVRSKGDTVWLEKYQYLYRDKLIRDSIFVNDTIRVPYPVEVEKPVKYVSGWENFQMWCGRILFVIVVVLCVIWYRNRKKFF